MKRSGSKQDFSLKELVATVMISLQQVNWKYAKELHMYEKEVETPLKQRHSRIMFPNVMYNNILLGFAIYPFLDTY